MEEDIHTLVSVCIFVYMYSRVETCEESHLGVNFNGTPLLHTAVGGT